MTPAETGSATAGTPLKKDVPRLPRIEIDWKKVIPTSVAALIVLTIIGLAAQHHAEYQEPLNPTGIGRDITGVPSMAIKNWNIMMEKLRIKQTPIVTVPETFDPEANKSSVGAGINEVSVTPQALADAYREQVSQNNDGHPTVLFPVIFTAPGQRVDYAQNPLTIQENPDPVTGQTTTKTFPGSIEFNFSKGEKIPLLADSAEIFQFKPWTVNGKDYPTGIFVKWQANGKEFAYSMGNKDVRTFHFSDEVLKAPLTPDGGNWRDKAKNGLQLPLGTTIATVDLNSDFSSEISFFVNNPQTGWESIKPNFVKDNSTGQTKLMLQENNIN